MSIKIKRTKQTYVNKFRSNLSKNSVPKVHLSRETYIKTDEALNKRLEQMFNGEIPFEDSWFGEIAEHARKHMVKKSDKFHNNTTNGIHLYYLIQQIHKNLYKISDNIFNEEFKKFLVSVIQNVVVSLIKFDSIIIKIILKDQLKDKDLQE